MELVHHHGWYLNIYLLSKKLYNFSSLLLLVLHSPIFAVNCFIHSSGFAQLYESGKLLGMGRLLDLPVIQSSPNTNTGCPDYRRLHIFNVWSALDFNLPIVTFTLKSC